MAEKPYYILTFLIVILLNIALSYNSDIIMHEYCNRFLFDYNITYIIVICAKFERLITLIFEIL